jgi:hypothetical protein
MRVGPHRVEQPGQDARFMFVMAVAVVIAVAVVMVVVMVMVVIVRAGVAMLVVMLAVPATDLHNCKHARTSPLQHLNN